MKEKTYVEDVDRNMYDFRNDEKDAYRIKERSHRGHCGKDLRRET